MKKDEKEYIKKYGDIPITHDGRTSQLIGNINFKRLRESVYSIIDRITSIKWKKHSFVIYLVPKGTPRPRCGQRGIFYVKGAKDNHERFKEFLSKYEDIDIIYTPCKFECRSYLPIPSSMNKVEQLIAEMGFIRPISKPDWDNLGKAYCDMIQETLLLDDAYVIEGISKKFYSIKPRIEIDIEYMEDFDSDFNRKKVERKVKKYG